jgi:hypothetical protein
MRNVFEQYEAPVNRLFADFRQRRAMQTPGAALTLVLATAIYSEA